MSRRAVRTGLSAWMILLAGPNIWLTHFTLVYAAASLELTLAPRAGAMSRVAIGALTLLALGGLAFAAWRAQDASPGEPGSALNGFWLSGTRLLCLISAVAVVYQALPALLVP